jgi:hypothetical protein
LLRLRAQLLRASALRIVNCLRTIGPLLLMMCLRGVLAVTAFSSMRRMWHLMGVHGVPGGMSMWMAVSIATHGRAGMRTGHTMMKMMRMRSGR